MGSFRGIALALAFALGLAGCEEAPKAASAPTGTPEPGIVFQGFKARGTLAGVKQWEALADSARVFQAARSADAEKVDITYFQAGRPVSWARADKARINLATNDLEVEGGVRVKGANGVVLLTETLRWDNAAQEARTRARVKVLRHGSVLTGRGLIADRQLERVEVQEDVKIESASVEELRKFRRP
jgi:LPS export ABC transporter protein LptC